MTRQLLSLRSGSHDYLLCSRVSCVTWNFAIGSDWKMGVIDDVRRSSKDYETGGWHPRTLEIHYLLIALR